MRALLAAALVLLGGCGHVIPGALTGDGKPFDFRKPPCEVIVPGEDPTKVEVRYLGAGGLYVRWRNEAILLGPHFTNPGIVEALKGKSRFDELRIRDAVASLGPTPVTAILAGHSHYDHIGDLPIVARQPNVADARLYVNATGGNMLSAYADLRPRTTVVRPGEEHPLSPSFRVRVIASSHAPQIVPINLFAYARGEVREPWTDEWKAHRLRHFLGGETLAFAIDVRDGDRTRFRIYYNDASSGVPHGQTDGDFDLAVLTMAQWNFVCDYPRHLFAKFQARHVLVSHFENFFDPKDGDYRFVGNLSNRSAARFLRILKEEAAGGGAPTNAVCGVKTAHYTMPVPRSTLQFEPRR